MIKLKKLFKSRLFLIIITAIICASGSVLATTTILSNSVSYEPSNTSWDVNNVQDALDDLYTLATQNEIINLTSKTTNENSCYDLKKVTAINNKSNNDLLIRLEATKVTENCNTNYTIDISDLNLSTITYNTCLSLISVPNLKAYVHDITTTNIKLYADTNYGYGNKFDYDIIYHLKYNIFLPIHLTNCNISICFYF